MHFLVLIFFISFASLSSERLISSEEYLSLKRTVDLCEDDLTIIPPFVSSHKYAQQDKAYENVREGKDRNSKIVSHLPLRSLVEILPEAFGEISELLFDTYKNGLNSTKSKLRNIFLPIRVISPNNALAKQLSKREIKGRNKINMSVFAPKEDKLAKKDSFGYINSLSLDMFNDNKYIYRIRKDAPLFMVNGKSLNNMVISLKKFYDHEEGMDKYKASKCCVSKGDENLCHLKNYHYEARDLELDVVVKFTQKDIESCCTSSFNTYLKPIPIEHHEIYMKALDILSAESQFKDDEEDSTASLLIAQDIAHKRRSNKSNSKNDDTLLKVPLFKTDHYYDINHKTKKKVMIGPFSSYHYNPLGSRSDESNDEWGKPLAVCSFLQTLKHWDNETCYGRDHCKVGFGHIYHPEHLQVHESHEKGECFDIRPFNSNILEKYHTNHYKNRGYDRETTSKFIDLLKLAGAKNIYFNDPKIYKKKKGVRYVKGHNNHIHFCFPSKSEKVLSTCREGIKTDEKLIIGKDVKKSSKKDS